MCSLFSNIVITSIKHEKCCMRTKCPTFHCMDTHTTKRAFFTWLNEAVRCLIYLRHRDISCDIVDTQDEITEVHIKQPYEKLDQVRNQ